MQTDLIYDIGMHRGSDSQFYLAKGFRVIGVEAVHHLCEIAKAENTSHIQNGRFTIVENALHTRSNEIIKFFINPLKDDWGSLERNAAEKGVGVAEETSVWTISLQDLIARYGVPYYIKCDIEGGDAIFVRSLLSLSARPAFVSIEATSGEDIAILLACGYDRFQIVNQYNHPNVKCPFPAREGNYIDAGFTHETSGLFGKELPPEKWDDFTSALLKFTDWYDLHNRDPNLAIGWLDVHCTTATILNSALNAGSRANPGNSQ
jgi:FkbM family methyltransferase